MATVEPKTGLRVGEYVVEEPIGESRFATVWRARHHAWPERLAAAKLTDSGHPAALMGAHR